MFSIVIPTLQKDNDVLNLLLNELTECKYIGEIIIIDNTNKGFSSTSNKVIVINPTKNLYVNPAWNLGISKSNFEYIGLINDDIIFPKNIFSQIYDFLQSDENIGLVGLDSIQKSNKSDFKEYPKDGNIKFYKIDVRDNCWGSAIFGKKSNFYKIPEDIKIWCGDDYLFYKNIYNNKNNYKISNIDIKHLHSNTSKNQEFNEIKRNDVFLYEKLDLLKSDMKQDDNKKFDLFVSLGAACSCTQTLRLNHLQYYSYPFDWLYGSTFLKRINFFSTNFGNWFNKEDLEYLDIREELHPYNIYKNKKTDIVFNHDFKTTLSFEEAYQEAKNKYNRRISRLLNQIENSNNVLFVYITNPNNREEVLQKDLIIGYELLKKRFQKTDIHILYLFSTREVPFGCRKVIPITEKITRISCDYDFYNEKYPYLVNYNVLKNIFKQYKLTSKNLDLPRRLKRLINKLQNFLQLIFSVKNDYINEKKQKVITIFFIKIKFICNGGNIHEMDK